MAILIHEADVEYVKDWSSRTGDNTGPIPTACSGGFSALPKADWSLLQGRGVLLFVEDSRACFEAVIESEDMARKAGVQEVYAAALTSDDLGKIFSSCDSAHRTQYAGVEITIIPLKDFASIARERYGIAPQVLEALPSAQTLKVFTASEIANMDYHKEREYILEPIMQVKGLIMVYAPRGLGKSWVALTMAYAIATGRVAFDRWTAPRARIVLYLDGEMSMEMIQERLNAIAAGFGDQEPSSNLKLCCADAQDAPIRSIATPEGQEAITALLDGVEVLVVDNLATLATGASENSTEGWASLQAFFLGLRRKGHSVLMVHHSGKNGDQRGSSAREDILDTSITLTRPKDYKAQEGARAEVHLTKARGLAGPEAEPFEIQLRHEGGVARWECRQDEDERIKVIRPLLEQEMSYRDIEEHTGIPRTTVGRLAKRIRNDS
ncbi:AAA family ATPase [Desulfocurvibacter africanus]|uniref:AAA family ATPase n=1 Tax=Desulfocurvibacter africanus TaxID=873 RepID=UPI001378BE6B|nr:AAA family ATPase [Desulfocurvibacter africanus]